MMHTMTYVLLLIASVCIVPLVAIEYIFTPLTRTQMNQVVHWGVSELFFRHSDVCWKDSYGNTAGIPMICAPGLSQEGALCYTKCKSGFYNTPAALFCYNRCPSGFRDDGLFCAKPGPYGRGVGRSCLHGWFQCSCNSNEDLNGLMCYPKCRAGFHSVGCCICSPNCPSGWNDIGVSCTKPSHGRSVHPLTSCPAGYQRSGLLCYPTCRPGYHMVGPVCWKTCPLDQKSDCGLLCSKDAGRCAIATVDMILAPITIVANVFTFGAASKVAAAKKVLTNTFRLSRESTMRLSTMMSRGLIQSQYGLLLDSEIQVIINALESGIEELYEPMKNIYGTINAVNSLREIAIAQAMIIVSTSLKEYGLTIASFIDPTGIMSVISAFAKPSCRDRQPPPHFSGITHAPPTGGTIPPSTRPPPPPFPTTQTPTITTTPTTPTDIIQTTTVTPTPTPTPSPCSDPCVSSSALDECVPGTCIGFSNNATGNREMDGTCLSTYTCTIRDICGGRDMIPPPTCIYGTAIWSPVDCSYQCPTTCTDGNPFHDCTNITCTSSTCNNGYECHINPCGNTTCTTMCTFNPHIACTNHPCSNKQVETECEANTCVADYSFGCDYTCTPKNTTCFPSSSDELPICRVGVATWDIVTCSWLCPSLCPDSTPIRTCSSTTTCDCLPGYTCTIDYCSGQECNKTCVPPSISTSSSCTTNPCQTKQAIDGCIENTCTYNMTYGCDFTCEYRPTSVLSATFVVYLSFPSNTSFDVISITIQSQLRDIAIRANMIEYFIINQDHIIQLHNSTSTAYQITIGIRGNNIQENVQQQMLSQFLTTLDNAAALQVQDQDQDQQQVHTFAIDTTYVEIKSQMMYTQTCPDGTTIGVAASCIGNEAIVETVSSSISSSSSSSMKATTIISIVIPIVVVILVITVIAIIIVKRSRRHTTHVQKMGDQVELQSNPAAGLGSNTL